MKIVIWNVMNGMGRPEQIDLFKSLQPDLAILPELKEKNINALKPNDAVWITNNHENNSPKGLGLLSFNQTSLYPLSRDEDMEIYIPVSVYNPSYKFDLLGVWNFYFECKQGRFRGVKGKGQLEWAAIERYKRQLVQPCLFAGDWNLGPTFAQDNFLRICEELDEINIKSLYHEFHQLDLSTSNNMTFRTPTKKYHHLDHFFGSELFVDNMVGYEIMDVDKATLSDHSPVVLSLR